MKSVSTVRNIDELGRVVIPADLRKILNINPKDEVEIICKKNRIIVKKSKDIDK